MTVDELMKQLRHFPGNAVIVPCVGWAADTAISDSDTEVSLTLNGGHLRVEGWLSDCGTELEIGEDI
jgi:hypothetical protein